MSVVMFFSFSLCSSFFMILKELGRTMGGKDPDQLKTTQKKERKQGNLRKKCLFSIFRSLYECVNEKLKRERAWRRVSGTIFSATFNSGGGGGLCVMLESHTHTVHSCKHILPVLHEDCWEHRTYLHVLWQTHSGFSLHLPQRARILHYHR